ncbi:MAG: 40S ribosomal protein S7 [Amphiamblys sp. WSBS2006]|nr:MAG: 40S ribosomal protein S7 [Amphiamblys sp. WSBS2006]
MRIEEGVRKRIYKTANEEVTGLDLNVATALANINRDADKTKDPSLAGIETLCFKATEEVDLEDASITLISVPVDKIEAWHRIQSRVMMELEKKLGKKVFLTRCHGAEDSADKKEAARKTLEDLAYPSEIVGRRTRFATDGKKTALVFLDREPSGISLSFLDEFAKKITGQETRFMAETEAV